MKNLILIIVMCLVSLPAFAKGGEKGKNESAFDRVVRTGVLRCAYASVGLHIQKDMETGKIVGPIADIAESMAKQLGLSVEWVAEVGYADFAEGLKNKRYDAFCGVLAVAPNRGRVAAFTNPLFYVPYFVHVRQDENRFSSLEDMNNKQVKAGVIDGEVFQNMTRKYLPNATEYSLPNMTPGGNLFVELADKKVDVVVYDPLTMLEYTRNNPGKIKRALADPLEVYPIAFAISPGEQDLLNMLNVGIMAMHNFGIIDDILDGYGIDKNIFYRVAKPYEVK